MLRLCYGVYGWAPIHHESHGHEVAEEKTILKNVEVCVPEERRYGSPYTVVPGSSRNTTISSAALPRIYHSFTALMRTVAFRRPTRESVKVALCR